MLFDLSQIPRYIQTYGSTSPVTFLGLFEAMFSVRIRQNSPEELGLM